MRSKTLLFLFFIINLQAAEREESPGQKSPRRPSLLDLVRVQVATRDEDSKGHVISPNKKQSPKTPIGTPEEGSPGRQSPKNSPKGLKALFRRSHGDLAEAQKADEIQHVQTLSKTFKDFEKELNDQCQTITMFEIHEPTNYEANRDAAIKKYKQLLAASRPALLRQLQEEKPHLEPAEYDWDATALLMTYQSKLNERLESVRKAKKS